MVKDSDNNDEIPEIDPLLKTEILETQKCPECGSTRLVRDYEYVEVVCMDCGFTNNQKIAEKKTVLQYAHSEQKLKSAKNDKPLTFTIQDKGSTTIIDWHNQDSHNKNPLAYNKTQVYRLRKWQRRIRVTGSTERNLTYALSEITQTANKLDLPKNILETAAAIYQKANKKHLINVHSIRDIATASLYLSCRQHEIPKTLDDIAHASSLNKKELKKSYRFLIKKLDYTTPPIQLNQRITKLSKKITVQKKIEETTHKILTAAKDNKLTAGRSPTGIMAAASYITLILINEHKTQKEIADIAQITETTIKNRYKELTSQLMFEISL